jgi:hypothetical protein
MLSMDRAVPAHNLLLVGRVKLKREIKCMCIRERERRERERRERERRERERKEREREREKTEHKEIDMYVFRPSH